MKITVIGTGYVGLVTGACFSEFGFDITCVDTDPRKIEALQAGRIPIFEPGLEALVQRSALEGRLRFTTEAGPAIENSDVIFITVGTPSRRGDGHADVSFVVAAAETIADHLNGYKIVVTKSTVPVGTTRRIAEVIRKRRPDAQFDVASNPEFLREGSAVEDFMRPDRVIVGVESERAREVLRQLYRPLHLIETPILFADLETAEVIKYTSNAFLAMKITFINQVADLCEKVGADVHNVAKGIGLDRRIGPKFLHPGPGYGGSCFPKDTLALVQTARDHDAPIEIIETVVRLNDQRKIAMVDRIAAALDGNVQGKRIAVLGLTFKPNTDDMRESPSLVILPRLQEMGAKLRCFDPVGMTEARDLMPDLTYSSDPYEAMQDADAVVFLTEWNSFRALDLERMKQILRRPVVVDLRNIYRPADMRERGFAYHSIGRK
ncbi:UDP-glucose dehydrogenase family protein [Dongia soli]|uniref:UDP-glucose 6-dehydrogenase n=1 Tax=Dongia soli TaxID=600628 RepID=A0ABU5E8M3_9PROT|nr:UDP-glucose/GDP-mannose dehydrogenase family protein [Dongia soli]MDY0882394.1 UDP-glucose/GDP-mannose dehydrogenase family protein [Dongia soli]